MIISFKPQFVPKILAGTKYTPYVKIKPTAGKQAVKCTCTQAAIRLKKESL